MKKREISVSSEIEEKIAWARDFFREHGQRLKRQGPVRELISRLEKAISASSHEMERIGIADICARCERDEGGSCCGAGIEDRYDAWSLVINLMLGAELPEKRWEPASCFFLGRRGCLLKARHVICINYLCDRITSRISPQRLEHLRDLEGEEILLHFRLHELLMKTGRDKMRE